MATSKAATSKRATVTRRKISSKAEAVPAKKAGKPGIGAFCSDLILKKKSNEEVLSAVQKKFPGASTTAASISWYRSKLRSEGKKV